MAHPRADFAQHYTIPYWVEAGFAACALNTRYLNNDTMMLHENLLLDLAAAIRFLREEEGFERVVMLGNSGGGSLFAYYDAQARAPHGQRVGAPPGGGPPDLNRFELPPADGLILLAAHPGQGMVLMGSIDAAVTDENNPFANDPELDMYDERNGYRTPPAHSRYAPQWLASATAPRSAPASRASTRSRAAMWPRRNRPARPQGCRISRRRRPHTGLACGATRWARGSCSSTALRPTRTTSTFRWIRRNARWARSFRRGPTFSTTTSSVSRAS